ncbi:MAG: hypothetical protein ACI9TY_001278 [Alphaproteobacteria bacterium]|jgi:hypothetical protein
MSDKKPPMSPSDYFPVTDVIVGEHEKNIMAQERTLFAELKPTNKIAAAFMETTSNSDFWVRANGAGQLSFYRAANFMAPMVHALVSCRILSPSTDEDAKPELSFRFSIQIDEDRYYFARINAIKLEGGSSFCSVCAIKASDFTQYHFQSPDGHTFTGSNLEYPITDDDMATILRLNQEDLAAAVNLAKLLIKDGAFKSDNETLKMLMYLGQSIVSTQF